MKKFLALIMACAFACIATAASSKSTLLFSRAQFQPETASENLLILTVPLIYKGTATVKAEALYNIVNPTPEATHYVCLDNDKGTIPVYMTICQPCIDCYPCQDIPVAIGNVPVTMANHGAAASTALLAGEKITKWNLYFVDTYKDGGEKHANIYKVNMATEAAKFYSGSNKSGSLVYNTKGLWLSGKRNDYKFAYTDASLAKVGEEYVWTAKGSKGTAYIKSIATLAGSYDPIITEGLDGFVAAKFNCTFKLSRNASLTKEAIAETFSSLTISNGKNWEDCSTVENAKVCEEFFRAPEPGVYDGFDAYLMVDAYKKYDVDFYTGTIDKALADIVLDQLLSTSMDI